MFAAMSVISLGLWGLGLASGAATGPWLHLFLGAGLAAAGLALVSAPKRKC